MTDDFWKDAEIIDVYTDEQAVEDGVIIPVGFGIISRITRTVLEDFRDTDCVERFLCFMNAVMKELGLQRKAGEDWFYRITIDNRDYFICENGGGFTLMKPEDY